MGMGAVASWLTGISQRYTVVRGQSAPPGSVVLNVISMMMWFMDKLGTRFITVSNYDRSDLVLRKICRDSQVTAIHDGIDLCKFTQKCPGEFRKRYNIPENAYMVGMIGRLTFQKRYGDFVAFMGELYKRKENVYGFLIGEGEDREKLQRQIDALKLRDRVRITGFVDHMHEVYSDLNLTMLFSNFEGLPNVLIESAASGIPLIANDVCGNCEIVIHEENGYLVKTGDIIQAVTHAEKLMENPDLAQRLGERGKEIAYQCFDKEKQVAKFIRMITSS